MGLSPNSDNNNIQNAMEGGEGSVNVDDDDGYDGPVFLNPDEAEEVLVIDENDNMPMEEEEEDDDSMVARDNNPDDDNVPDISLAQLTSHTGPVYAIDAYLVAPDRLRIVSGGGDDQAYLHTLGLTTTASASASITSTESQRLEYVHNDSVSCVASNLEYITDDVAKTPPLIATGSFDGTIVIYDADTGRRRHVFADGLSDIEWLCFHPTGGTVLLAGSATDCTIWMYHLTLQRCLQVFVGHERAVNAGAFSPDGKWVLSASADGTVRIWAPRSGVCKHVFKMGNKAIAGAPASLICLATHGGSDGQLIIVGTEDGQAHVCHIGTKKVVASLRHYDRPPNNNNSVTDEENDTDLPMSVEAVGFASLQVNSNWCATGGVDGVLKIFDLANNGQCRQVCRVPDTSGGGITKLLWHPTLPLVFTSSTNGSIYLWDARNGQLLHTLSGHTNTVNDMTVKFLDQGQQAIVVSASDDQRVLIFHVNIVSVLPK